MNLKTLQWDDELLRRFPFQGRFCRRFDRAARYMTMSPLGPLSGVAVAGILGDPAGGAGGTDMFQERRSQEHLRHGLLLLMNTGESRGIETRTTHDHAYKLGNQGQRDMRWKQRPLLPARWCSGCATSLGLIKTSAELKNWRLTV